MGGGLHHKRDSRTGDGGCRVIGRLLHGDSGTCPGAWD